MAALTIGAIIAFIGTIITGGVSIVLAIGSFFSTVFSWLFQAFKAHPIINTAFYWSILFIDTFIVGTATGVITGPLFEIVGIEDFTLNFTSIVLLPINIFTLSIFGFAITSLHLLLIVSVFLLFAMATQIRRIFVNI